jgi:hypothetical protein
MPFELPGLTATGPDVEVLEGGVPQRIIDTGNTFNIVVTWSVDLPGVNALGGDFLVRTYAESIGPGQERQLAQVKVVPVSSGVLAGGPPATRRDYVADVLVAAGTLDAEEPASSGGPQSSGVYKLVVIVTHQSLGDTEIAGFSEGPLIQMRNP